MSKKIPDNKQESPLYEYRQHIVMNIFVPYVCVCVYKYKISSVSLTV